MRDSAAPVIAARRHRWRRRLSAALFALGLGVLLASAQSPERHALVLHWDGAIGPATADYITRGLREAGGGGTAVVVLRLDTPGGLDTSMREIIRAILDAPVPVLTYVSPSGARAASAGTYMLYASHIAAMSPGTNLGAATPVSLGGGLPQPERDGGKDEDPPAQDRAAADDDTQDNGTAEGADAGQAKDKPAAERPRAVRGNEDAMRRKVVNDAVAYIRALAELRGRNADWAEEAVREGASLPAQAALERQVIDIIAHDVADLLAQAHQRRIGTAGGEITLDTADLAIEHLRPDWRTRLLATITNPNVAVILMLIAFYGLMFEFMNPGAFYPGTIGAICLLLGLYALAALPVNYAGLGLMLLGLLLMTGEAFMPSFGVLGIGGTIAFVLGATILIDTEAPGFELSWPVIVAVAAASLVLTLVIVRLAVSSSRRAVTAGREAMLGTRAEVIDWHEGRGHVFTHGERWQAVSAAQLAPGATVRIAAVDDLTLTVEPVSPADPSDEGESHAR